MQLELSYSEPNRTKLAFDNSPNAISFTCEVMRDLEDVAQTEPSRLLANLPESMTKDMRRHALVFKSETEMLHAIAEENGLYRQMGSDEGFYDRYYASSDETAETSGRRQADNPNLVCITCSRLAL